jgi:hypothetical protein
MSQTLSLPTFDSGDVSDTGSAASELSTPATKFPHTRAQLAAIARQHRPADGYENDADAEDHGRFDSSFVAKVVGLLDEEHEEELKSILKDAYSVDDEMVSHLMSPKLVYTIS